MKARKYMRLGGHDYSQAGYYFVTICVKDGHEMLGEIVVGDGVPDVPPISSPDVLPIFTSDVPPVFASDALHTSDAPTIFVPEAPPTLVTNASVMLSRYGRIVKKHLLALDKQYEDIAMKHYVIMPNHIHMIVAICARTQERVKCGRADRGMTLGGYGCGATDGDRDATLRSDRDEASRVCESGASRNCGNGTSRTPSPTNAVIPRFVSTFKRFVNKDCGFSLFQRSYYDHIIRDEEDYGRIVRYIDENPARWTEDKYYTK